MHHKFFCILGLIAVYILFTFLAVDAIFNLASFGSNKNQYNPLITFNVVRIEPLQMKYYGPWFGFIGFETENRSYLFCIMITHHEIVIGHMNKETKLFVSHNLDLYLNCSYSLTC